MSGMDQASTENSIGVARAWWGGRMATADRREGGRMYRSLSRFMSSMSLSSMRERLDESGRSEGVQSSRGPAVMSVQESPPEVRWMKPPRMLWLVCPSIPSAAMIMPSVAPVLRPQSRAVGHGVIISRPGAIFLSDERKNSSPRANSIHMPQRQMEYIGRPKAAPGGMRLSKQCVSCPIGAVPRSSG